MLQNNIKSLSYRPRMKFFFPDLLIEESNRWKFYILNKELTRAGIVNQFFNHYFNVFLIIDYIYKHHDKESTVLILEYKGDKPKGNIGNFKETCSSFGIEIERVKIKNKIRIIYKYIELDREDINMYNKDEYFPRLISRCPRLFFRNDFDLGEIYDYEEKNTKEERD